MDRCARSRDRRCSLQDAFGKRPISSGSASVRRPIMQARAGIILCIYLISISLTWMGVRFWRLDHSACMSIKWQHPNRNVCQWIYSWRALRTLPRNLKRIAGRLISRPRTRHQVAIGRRLKLSCTHLPFGGSCAISPFIQYDINHERQPSTCKKCIWRTHCPLLVPATDWFLSGWLLQDQCGRPWHACRLCRHDRDISRIQSTAWQ